MSLAQVVVSSSWLVKQVQYLRAGPDSFLCCFCLIFPSTDLHIPVLSLPCPPSSCCHFYIHSRTHHLHHSWCRAFLLELLCRPAERLTIENLWNLRLDVPVGPRRNDRGTAAPAQVYAWAALLWWGYPPLSFFRWFFFTLHWAGQRAPRNITFSLWNAFNSLPVSTALVGKVLY